MAEASVVVRQRAIERYGQGESVTAICRSLKRSREWFYKWQARAASGESAWARSVRGGPRAHRLACRTPWRPGFSRCARVWSRAGSFAAPRRSRGSSKSSAFARCPRCGRFIGCWSGRRPVPMSPVGTSRRAAVSNAARGPSGRASPNGLRRPVLLARACALLQSAQRRSGDGAGGGRARVDAQQSGHHRRGMEHLASLGPPAASTSRQRDGVLRESRASTRDGAADPALPHLQRRTVVYSPGGALAECRRRQIQ